METLMIALDSETMRRLGIVADRTMRGSIPAAAAMILKTAVASIAALTDAPDGSIPIPACPKGGASCSP